MPSLRQLSALGQHIPQIDYSFNKTGSVGKAFVFSRIHINDATITSIDTSSANSTRIDGVVLALAFQSISVTVTDQNSGGTIGRSSTINWDLGTNSGSSAGAVPDSVGYVVGGGPLGAGDLAALSFQPPTQQGLGACGVASVDAYMDSYGLPSLLWIAQGALLPSLPVRLNRPNGSTFTEYASYGFTGVAMRSLTLLYQAGDFAIQTTTSFLVNPASNNTTPT